MLRKILVLVPILLLYSSLAFYRLDQQSLWTDEVASLNSAFYGESLSDSAIWRSGHGPLYFVFLHFWMELGQTEFIIRSLSVIFAMAAVCLTYAVGLRLIGPRFAAVSAILLGTSPFLIWYSQEVRYITLAIATVLLSKYLLLRALSSDSLKFWVFYAVATMIALFAFVPNVFVVIGEGIYVLWLRNRSHITRWVSCLTPVIVVFGIWLLITYGGLTPAGNVGPSAGSARVGGASLETGTPREISLAAIPYTFFAFTSGFSMGPSTEELHISRDLASLLEHLPTIASLGLYFGGLFFFGIAQLRGQPRIGLLLLWLVIPILGVFAISALSDVAYNVRYVCAALPPYIFFLAAGITSLRKGSVQFCVLVVVLLANGLSLTQYYFNARYAKPDARAAARLLKSAGDPRDVILLVGNSGAWRYYYKGDLPVVRWSMAENSSWTTVRKNVQSLSKVHDRLWLLAIRPWETDPNGNVKRALDKSLHKTRDLALPGVEISSYVRGANSPKGNPAITEPKFEESRIQSSIGLPLSP